MPQTTPACDPPRGLAIRLLGGSLLCLGVAACSPPPGEVAERFQGLTMGTTWSATVTLDQPMDGAARRALQEAIEAELEAINAAMSTYLEDSDLSRFNGVSADQPVAVALSVLQVLTISRRVFDASGGAFDPTVGPLVDLWGFGPGEANDAPPTEAELRKAQALVGLDRVMADPASLTLTKKQKGLRLDLSAVAKGYAVDQVALALERRGRDDFLIEVGGEVVVHGERPGGGPWRLAVEDPSQKFGDDPQPRALVRLLLENCALATSGDYRNWRRLGDGTRISHTIDPRTGRPVESDLAAASVVAPTCAVADAWATALMVLGEEGLDAIEALPDVEALLQFRRGDELVLVPSSGWGSLEVR